MVDAEQEPPGHVAVSQEYGYSSEAVVGVIGAVEHGGDV